MVLQLNVRDTPPDPLKMNEDKQMTVRNFNGIIYL